MEWQIQRASQDDIPRVAALFLDSFRDTVAHFFGEEAQGREKNGGEALEDFFDFLLAEEGAFWVARHKEEKKKHLAEALLPGYIIVSADLTYLWRRAVCGGYIFHWMMKYLRGAYGVNTRVVWQAMRNKFAFFKHSCSMPQYSSQILSFAVAEQCRGQGLAETLLRKGLNYLQERGRHQIKLEVRPGNKPALRLYLRHGFSPVGTTRDSQGEWLVMVKEKPECEDR